MAARLLKNEKFTTNNGVVSIEVLKLVPSKKEVTFSYAQKGLEPETRTTSYDDFRDTYIASADSEVESVENEVSNVSEKGIVKFKNDQVATFEKDSNGNYILTHADSSNQLIEKDVFESLVADDQLRIINNLPTVETVSNDSSNRIQFADKSLATIEREGENVKMIGDNGITNTVTYREFQRLIRENHVKVVA